MDESARIVKNSDIKNSIRETLTRHASMRPVVVEMKLDLKCLNKTEQEKLWHYFTQCRWLCNYLISLDADAFKSFDTKNACQVHPVCIFLHQAGYGLPCCKA